MGWKEVPADLTSRIWNRFHVEKYLNEKLGKGKMETIRTDLKYRWSNGNVIVEILNATSKQGQIKIIKDGEKEIKSIWNLKDIKEMI